MWGMSHNVSWSFGQSLLDIFLAPESIPCSVPTPECQATSSIQYSRAGTTLVNIPTFSLTCEQQNFNQLNETLCAAILASASQDSQILYQMCHALSTISQTEVTTVWRNTCRMIQNVTLPLMEPCSGDPATVQLNRSARSALNLNELLCDYQNWTLSGTVDPALVTMCSENDRTTFISAVCNSVDTVQMLIKNPSNAWVWEFCSNTSDTYVVNLYCSYDTWTPENIDPSIVTFCWYNDMDRFEGLLCDSMSFFMIVFSTEENNWLKPNCSEPPAQIDINALVIQSCRYSEWKNLRAITPDQISLCIQNDETRFINQVCTNTSFITVLVLNSANAWVAQYCTYSMRNPSTSPPPLSVKVWCNYNQWSNMSVDSSVVALCWQYDQIGFRQNVCCNAALLEKLYLHPDNQWLISECTSNGTSEVVMQVCTYSDWSQPTIVDMSDLALCADLDTANFTRNVCANATVLQNLLANLDNTWLLKQCSNLTASVPGGGTGNGTSLMNFRPTEQCQYNAWSVVLPDAALLALCWDYDQANFISFVCSNSYILSHITQEASSLWVGALCASFAASQIPSVNASNVTTPQPCLIWELAKKLNWTCNSDFSVVCQPGASQVQGLQMLLRCGIKILQPRLEALMTPQVTSVVNQATSLWIVLLLALEESQMTSLRVTENIRLSVLESITTYMDNETNFDNKRVLLQCFGKVLTSLMQTGRDVPTNFFLIKEYFRIPLSQLRSVLSAADVIIAREILLYYNRNYAALQLSDDYLHTMVSVFFQVHLAKDISLFAEMGLLLTLATPSDIMSIPPLQSDNNLLSIINLSIKNLSLEQQQAFGRWLSQSVNTTAGSLSVIRDTGNLIAYVPFRSFQHLSPAQLLDGFNILVSNPMSLLKQQFVAQSLTGAFSNLTVDQMKRLGNLSCLAHPSDLMAYAGTNAFSVIQDNIRTCAIDGLEFPSSMIQGVVLKASEVQSPANLTSQRVSELASFLPLLGSSVLQQLSSAQLLPALSSLASVPFSPAQAGIIIDKISANFSLAVPGSGRLSLLGSLVSGVKVETLWTIPSDVLLEALPAMGLQTPGLTPPQVNSVAYKLWGLDSVSQKWMDKVQPLLSSTPLLCVIPRVPVLLTKDAAVNTRPWNTQQAQVLFKEAVLSHPTLSLQDFLSLGTMATGVDCTSLRKLFQNLAAFSPLLQILIFLRDQPVPLHPSLAKCITEELYKFVFFSDLLGDLGSQIALSLPLTTIKKFPPDKMDSLRAMIVQDPYYFLLLPSTKQAVLVDKIIQKLNVYVGLYTEEEFRLLGAMATFVPDEVFQKLDRIFFVDSLEFLRGFCYNAAKRDLVAKMLQETWTFGSVQNWTSVTLNQVDRFLFFLPTETIQLIPLGLMNLERIERLFLSQQEWQSGQLGSLCQDSQLFDKQQFVLQYFLGFLKMGRTTYNGLIPTCESLHVTQPAAWTIDSLRNMPPAAFRRCLELIGQDPFFSSFQLSVLLTKTKEVYGLPSTYNSSVISQLGRIATQLSLDELASLRLSDIQSISAMGALNTWTSKQLKSLFSAVLNSTRKTPNQLDSSTFVALGYIVCGIDVSVMRSLNPVEFSKAVLWLGRLRLSCSEEQLQALIGLLSHSLAFGPVSSWGSEVFIEIGAIAAGLPDIAMSALVKDQIEGITPLAISLIPAGKFAVVFNQAQIRMFTYDQAIAVTDNQRSSLSSVQQTALSMVLNPWEDKPVDFRGMSLGVALQPCPFSYLSSVLITLLSLLLTLG